MGREKDTLLEFQRIVFSNFISRIRKGKTLGKSIETVDPSVSF
jgi:hypothetical protein